MFKGKIWKFGDNIDTDQIISSQYLLLPTVNEMKKYAFESLKPDFVNNFNPGDIIVAGLNFGCGSSREQAPRVLKALGVSTIIAKSFARIFFRNSINIGLPLIICDGIYDDAAEGEYVTVSFEKGEIMYQNKNYKFEKFPEYILKIIKDGGLIECINKL